MFVFDLGQGPSLPAQLTAAERNVVRAVVAGRSAPQIACERGVRYRTVANQLASIYRKLRVNSAAELVALLTGSAETPRDPPR